MMGWLTSADPCVLASARASRIKAIDIAQRGVKAEGE